ncbi:MAG: nitrate reductase subunit beta [Chloroflexi bacterium]|nr:nitrate reductase subunit beta [Chloroflexota bacterium]
MDVRAQVAMVFHLDKCIGCHTCSIACKNLWTSREGTEYMWWNNVETKPGTGYPTLWEDQDKYRGGWEVKGNQLRPRLGPRLGVLSQLFYNPYLPVMDDYYEPWTYDYETLANAPAGDDQPTARPVSRVTGRYIDLEAGPNWDDDLSGSTTYARNDTNLSNLTDAERASLFQIEQMVFFYLPRICNHCLNPGCVAVCPSGAIYKRAEDGAVLISQEKCRGWRFCVSGCPYKKTYYNWRTGKSEKCILCYPRLEMGQTSSCFHSCVGRIRYQGILFYDADRIEEVARAPESELVEAQRSIILDPKDAAVEAGAKKNGINDAWIDAARRSPIYKFVKDWELALPLHAEFRTLPNLFYVPPLLPVINATKKGVYEIAETDYFGAIESARVPMKYMASLFSAGNEEIVKKVLKKLIAVRSHRQSKKVGNISENQANALLVEAGCTASEVEQIFRMTSLPRYEDRFVIPPYQRERDVETAPDRTAIKQKGQTGLGFTQAPRRGP